MASTYRPNQAFDYVKEMVKSEPLERVADRVLDKALKQLWMAAPWRWSVSVLAPMPLTGSTADISQVGGAATDFLYILRAYMTDGQTSVELHPESSLPAGGSVQAGLPNKIVYIPGTSKFRISPSPVTLPNSSSWYLVVYYKKISPVITRLTSNTGGFQVFDDEWFHVYEELVLWTAYLYADDNRAGSVTFADGKVQYTGQGAVALAALERMKASEPLMTQFIDKAQEERRAG